MQCGASDGVDVVECGETCTGERKSRVNGVTGSTTLDITHATRRERVGMSTRDRADSRCRIGYLIGTLLDSDPDSDRVGSGPQLGSSEGSRKGSTLRVKKWALLGVKKWALFRVRKWTLNGP